MAQPTSPLTIHSPHRFLWLKLLAGPLIWSLYFFVGYGVIEATCKSELARVNFWGFPALSVFVLGWTLLALLAALYMGFLAYRDWQRSPEDNSNGATAWGSMENYRPFMNFGGVLLSGLSSLTILMMGLLPLLFLQPC
jgi:hypothetical protein